MNFVFGLMLILGGVLCLPMHSAHAEGDAGHSPGDWQSRFTFEGQIRPGPYTVDPHIWVYTKEFAERFGMPEKWISKELKGVEAAAWRQTKTGFVTCGWGGKRDACKEETVPMLELYFDTRKVKMPWAPWSRESDHPALHFWPNSQRYLTTQKCERRREISQVRGFFGVMIIAHVCIT